LAFIDGSKVRLLSRRGLDLTHAFPEIVAELAAQAVDTMVIDGEIVALDAHGRPSFNALQNRAQLKTAKEIEAARRTTPVTLVCFDLLHFAGLNLRQHAYVDRRRYLLQCVLPSDHIQLIHASQDAETLYAAALEHGFEGIVGKRMDSTYQPGKRSAAWLKIKKMHTAEFVVGGFTKGKGARDAISALLLGYWRGQQLRYVGHVSSGLTDDVIAALRVRLADLTRKTSPFSEKPPLQRPTTWVEPKLVVEVSFQNRTRDGLLRAPVFVRLRDDVPVTAVRTPATRTKSKALATPANPVKDVLLQLKQDVAELTLVVGNARIRLTHLDREYWPADPRAGLPPITKRDLLRYLASVSSYMLPHLAHKPLTMIRMPDGIRGERFYQKHWNATLPPFVDTVKIFSQHKDEHQDYLVANNLPTPLWMGQIGTLEFHVWHSRTNITPDAVSHSTDFASSLAALESSVLNYPDYLVFDIDPYIYSGKEPPGAEPELNKKGFAVGKRVAFWLHDLLRQMSLEAIVKTSGKTGLHVFVPIERTLTFTEARHVCETIGRHLMAAHPREITLEWAVSKRTGKIFIDYNMNVRGKTLNVAYSPRGVSGAPVSMPLSWEELEAAEPMHFTMRNVLSYLEKHGDRWQDAMDSKQNLARVLRLDAG
jgi:bifunctional non-homologous end joining protein LigD